MLKRVKKLFMIILTVICLAVNSIGVAYIKPMHTNAAALPIVYVGIDTILKLLLGTVVTVSGIVAVNKADELGVFDDIYDSFMTEGSSALKEMPDYDGDREIGKLNGEIIYLDDYRPSGSGGSNQQPDLKDEELQRALKATSYMIESEFMDYMIDFVESKLKEDSDIESVREYYKEYGKPEFVGEDTELSSYVDVFDYNKRSDVGLFYNGGGLYYYTDLGTRMMKTRVVKFRFENIYGYSPTGLSQEGYYTDTSGYQFNVNPSGYESLAYYNGGRICLTSELSSYGRWTVLYEVGGEDKEFMINGMTLYGNPWNYTNYSLQLNEYDYETGLNGPTSIYPPLTTDSNFPIYPSSNIPVIPNYVDAVRYVMGVDGLENAINLECSYKLPCDDLMPKVRDVIKPLTNTELNAGILPDVIAQVENAIVPEPLPDIDPVKQPQELPQDYPQTVEKIVNDIVTESELPENEPIPSPTPTPSPIPTPFPSIQPEPPITDNKPIEEAIDKSLHIADVFPFCIPFDLIRLVNVLNVEAKAPYFEYPIKVDGLIDYTIVIDFTEYDELAQIVRVFETLIFIGGLILVTRKLIKG